MTSRRISRHRKSAPRSTAGETREAPIGSSKKALAILELVAASREPTPIAELIRRTGLTKPTAHRITAALAEMGLLAREGSRRGYIEGPRLIKLALDTLAAAAPRTLRHSILRGVSETVGETCNFGVLAGSEVIYLDRVEAKWPLGLRFEAGSRVPAHCTAIGKLLLAKLAPAERAAAIAALPLARYTGRTITDRAALAKALDDIAASEIGTDAQEFIDGVVCVAVPVAHPGGGVIGALALSAPQARVTLSDLEAYIPVMREAAARLSATFEAPGPPLADQLATAPGNRRRAVDSERRDRLARTGPFRD